MKNLYKYLPLILFFAMCTTEEGKNKKEISIDNKETPIDHLNGIWQLEETKAVITGNKAFYPSPTAFVFDSSTVTLHLVSISDFKNRSEDDIYRLSCKIENDSLYYILPFKDKWIKLAYLKGNAFYTSGGGKEWKYKKIQPDEIVSTYKALLKENRSLTH